MIVGSCAHDPTGYGVLTRKLSAITVAGPLSPWREDAITPARPPSNGLEGTVATWTLLIQSCTWSGLRTTHSTLVPTPSCSSGSGMRPVVS